MQLGSCFSLQFSLWHKCNLLGVNCSSFIHVSIRSKWRSGCFVRSTRNVPMSSRPHGDKMIIIIDEHFILRQILCSIFRLARLPVIQRGNIPFWFNLRHVYARENVRLQDRQLNQQCMNAWCRMAWSNLCPHHIHGSVSHSRHRDISFCSDLGQTFYKHKQIVITKQAASAQPEQYSIEVARNLCWLSLL